jgi:hypothetical protein
MSDKDIVKIFAILISVFIGGAANSGFFSKYWFPPSIRQYLMTPKYAPGECIEAKGRWGVNPKVVIGFKESNASEGYLLRDRDRHEHLQYVSKNEVERYAQKIACR